MVEWERYKKEGDHENLRMTTGKYFEVIADIYLN